MDNNKSKFTPPPKFRHYFDRKEELLQRKDELVNKIKKINKGIFLSMGIMFTLAIPMNLISSETSLTFVIFVFLPTFFYGFTSTVRKNKIIGELRGLKSEFDALGIEYKEEYKAYSSDMGSYASTPDGLGYSGYNRKGDDNDWNDSDGDGSWDDGDGSWDDGGDGWGDDGDGGWGDSGDGGWSDGGDGGDGGDSD